MRRADSGLTAIAAATARERILIRALRGEKMDAPGDKIAALIDLAETLTAGGIRFALIGGLAVGIHSGTPRATMDIDVVVPSATDRTAIIELMTGAEFVFRGEHAHSLNFTHPSGEPVQIAIYPPFDPMIARAGTVDVSGLSIPIVRKDDLIVMKERAGRDPARRRSKALRDQADAELLRGDVEGPDEGW